MNSRLEKAIQKILDLAGDHEIVHRARLELLAAAQDIMLGHAEYEDQLRELRELLYRNPAFPDDLVGWLDDDFDEDEDEDDS